MLYRAGGTSQQREPSMDRPRSQQQHTRLYKYTQQAGMRVPATAFGTSLAARWRYALGLRELLLDTLRCKRLDMEGRDGCEV